MEDDYTGHRIVRVDRRQKIQVCDLCRQYEWRSWTSVHEELDQKKFQRQNGRTERLEKQEQEPAACSYSWKYLKLSDVWLRR